MKTGDKDIETMIGNTLRWGVILSITVVIYGGIIYLVRHGNNIADYTVFKGKATDFTSNPAGIWSGVWQNKGRAIIQLGILLLIATPVTRVLLSAIGFRAERDHLYTAIALLVLAIIIFSMFAGMAG